jgi:hypothetical protein
MAIDINIPSQVKNYANLAGFPATGSLKTIFIAEDTNKTYRWTGSAYVEISASQATAWGTITGTLSAQTDLNTALSGKVPTTRTLTINGTTQDLSADRTFTISTGITIGTTAITSGTVGRVLFEGTGNVVQESANLFWDNTNGRLGIGGTPSAFKLDIVGTSSANIIGVKVRNTSTNGYTEINCYNNTGGDNDRIYFGVGGTATGDVYQNRGYFISSLALEGITFTAGKTTTGDMRFFTGGNNERLRIFGNGNIGINTTTDAGFKLDVNGTARVSGDLRITQSGSTTFGVNIATTGGATTITPISSTSNITLISQNSNSSLSLAPSSVTLASRGGNLFVNALNVLAFETGASSTERARFATTTGNLLINTTTDVASSKLTIQSTTQGFLPPRMTTTQKNAIATPVAGLMVYDTTLNLISVFNGTIWI